MQKIKLDEESAECRKPRIALMGEFSAGKSTLANLMIGTDSLPMQVIATQLPPIWISYGEGSPICVDHDGTEKPWDINDLASCPIASTSHIRLFCTEDILRMCDLIDMPGISDPNMDPDVWKRLLPSCDGVIWCTPATQAWRQSEAAVWASVDPNLYPNSILLLTRSDMLVSEKDRTKVLRRVVGETENLFAAQLMISLLEARDAEEDAEIWAKSGAEPFVTEFLSILHRLSKDMATTRVPGAMGSTRIFPQADEEIAKPANRVVPRRPPRPYSPTRTGRVGPETAED